MAFSSTRSKNNYHQWFDRANIKKHKENRPINNNSYNINDLTKEELENKGLTEYKK